MSLTGYLALSSMLLPSALFNMTPKRGVTDIRKLCVSRISVKDDNAVDNTFVCKYFESLGIEISFGKEIIF